MYPNQLLLEEGFSRRKCIKCGKYFWTIQEREICDECIDKYSFLEKGIKGKEMDYLDVWKEISSFMEKEYGYVSIRRYPVIPRWRDDVFFVQASIYDFQPHVTSGISPPPYTHLTVPQFCLRFDDLEAVGITSRHYVGFIMLGRHAFLESSKYDTNVLYEHIFDWVTKRFGIRKEDLCLIESYWEGGGNAGPCLETWIGGLEIVNTVFMIYKTNEVREEMKIKVLDEGQGYERIAWIASDEPSSYFSTFPTVMDFLESKTGIRLNREFIKEFTIYSKKLDECAPEILEKEIEKRIKDASLKAGTSFNDAKEIFEYYKAFSRIADFTRALLIALFDGAIPTNTGAGYYLRAILRYIFEIIRKKNLDFDIFKPFELHSKYLGKLYPEIKDEEYLEIIKEILDTELRKWEESRRRARKIASKYKEVSGELLRMLYESHGITPNLLRELGVKLPPDPYKYILKQKVIQKPKEIPLQVPQIHTEELFYKDLDKIKVRVLKVIDGKYAIFDKTILYPEGGGQKSDRGKVNGVEITRVFRVGKTIIHEIKGKIEEGKEAILERDVLRRKRLERHHTSTHILLQACRRVLGRHVWQQGAEKDEDEARLDISHYKDLSPEDIRKIEREANRIVLEGRKVIVREMDRNEAEKKYGFYIYQGGAPPEARLRIVEIEGYDVQACCGTHVKNTSEIGIIKITQVEKIKDGVYRIRFKAGDLAIEEIQNRDKILEQLSKDFRCGISEIYQKGRKIYEEWLELQKKNEEIERWILERAYKELKKTNITECPPELEISKCIALLKRIEKEGLENKVILVGDFCLILKDIPKDIGIDLSEYKEERRIGNIVILKRTN